MKTLKKSIIIAMLALGCFTTANAQEENPQARTEGKLKGKIIKGGDNGMISVSDENSETPTTKKGWDGTIKGRKNDSDSDVSQRKGINEGGLKKNDISATSSEKKGLNAVNVKLSKADSSFKDGEDGVSHTRPGNHKPGKSDETTTEDHAINTKRTGATKDGRAMLGLKGTALTNGRSVDGSDETNPTPQEHAVNEKGHGNSVKGEESKVIVKIIK